MGEIEIPRGSNGSIERFGATTKINDALDADFAARGRKTASLVIATLTETPHTPTIDGHTFEIEVSNRYRGPGETEDEGTDTVVEAREALKEFLQAEVRGSKKIKMTTLDTDYRKILRDLRPSIRDTRSQKHAFDESLVESLRAKDIGVRSPSEALAIVRSAPSAIAGLKLSNRSAYRRGVRNDMVTVDGRMINFYRFEGFGLATYYTDFLSADPSLRGGSAPRPGIAQQIADRVIQLRTEHAKR